MAPTAQDSDEIDFSDVVRVNYRGMRIRRIWNNGFCLWPDPWSDTWDDLFSAR